MAGSLPAHDAGPDRVMSSSLHLAGRVISHTVCCETCYAARVIPPDKGADAMAYTSPTIYPLNARTRTAARDRAAQKVAARRCFGARRDDRIAAPADRANHFESDRRACWNASYGNCPATGFYMRAATNPAATTTAAWASEFVGTRDGGFHFRRHAAVGIRAIAAKAMSITLPPGAGVVKIPSRTIAASLKRCVAGRRLSEACL